MRCKYFAIFAALILLFIVGFIACGNEDAPATIPDGLTVAEVGYDTTNSTFYVVVGWKTNKTAKSYVLYRSTEKDGLYSPVLADTNGNATPIVAGSNTYTFPAPATGETSKAVEGYVYYQDTAVTAGNFYFYKIMAKNGEGDSMMSTPLEVLMIQDKTKRIKS